MLVALAIFSLIANSLVSRVVVLSARVLENNTCWPRIQIYAVEIVYICLESITLILVIITRVVKFKTFFIENSIKIIKSI